MHVRVAPARFAGGLIAGLFMCGLQAACTRPADSSDRAQLAWSIEPSTPSTLTDTVIRVTVRDSRGQPLEQARLRLEAQMSHPGMAPVLTSLVGRGDGVYETPVRLSMAGDWILVVRGELPDRTRVGGSHDVRVNP